MAAPQTAQELLDVMARQEAAAKRIAALQAEIAKGGFIPADQQKHNALLAERIRMLAVQKQLEADIKRASPAAQSAVRVRQQSAERFREMQEQRQLIREQLAVQRSAREMDLRYRYGQRFGGMYAGLERFGQSRMGQTMAGGVSAFGATVGGMARSGFGGTVEKNRFDDEMGRVSREVAGAFKPLLDLGTRLATRVRKTMEGMNEGQQDALMYGGLAAGAFGAYRYGGRLLGGLAGYAMGGPMGAMGGAAMAGGGAGMAGGGMAARLGGWGRAAGRAAPWLMVGSVAMSMAGFGEQQAEQENPYSHTFASQNPEMAKLLDGKTAAERRAMLATAEENKPNMLLRGLGSAGKWGRNTGAWALNQIPIGERIKYIDESSSADQLKRELQRRGDVGKDGRRQLTPDAFAYEDVGSAYKRASLSFLRQEANQPGAAGAGSMPGASGNPVATPAEVQAGLNRVAEILERIEQQGQPKADVR